MSTLRRQPVSAAKVVLGTLVTLLLLGGVVLLAEWLRPGRGTPAGPITAEHDADPRVPVDCEAVPAREGRREQPPRDTRPRDVTSSELYDCPTVWDGRPVRFTGEVVGGILQRGDEAWLQLNDDPYSLPPGPLPYHRDFRGGNGGVGVLVPVRLIEPIRSVGGPRLHGDVVQVTGTFRRVDPPTREIAIVRADTLRVLRSGTPLRPSPAPERVAVGTVLGLLAAALLLYQWHLARRA